MRMSQIELSRMIGVYDNAVYHWESGVYLPRLDAFASLCGVLNCSPSDLIVEILS